MIQPEILNKIEQHLNHACTKHPNFVQDIEIGKCADITAGRLARKRKILEYQNKWGELSLSAVLTCEMWEFFDAIANARLQEAIEEGYDIIAVVLRAIERIKKIEVVNNQFRDTTKMMPEVAVAENATTTPTCDKSSQVGNAAAMYEALKAVVKVGYPHNFQHEAPHISGYCYEITTAIDKCFAALATSPRNCDIMSLNTARKEWFTKEILPRLNGDLPLGKEVPFEEWFVSQHEKRNERRSEQND